MVTDVTTKLLSLLFSLFETSLIHRIMAHRLLLVFAATKFGKIGSCAQTAAGLRSRQGACFQTRPWKCKDARSGTLSWVWPRLSLRPWRWVGGWVGGGESGRELGVCVFTLMIDSAVKQCN